MFPQRNVDVFSDVGALGTDEVQYINFDTNSDQQGELSWLQLPLDVELVRLMQLWLLGTGRMVAGWKGCWCMVSCSEPWYSLTIVVNIVRQTYGCQWSTSYYGSAGGM